MRRPRAAAAKSQRGTPSESTKETPAAPKSKGSGKPTRRRPRRKLPGWASVSLLISLVAIGYSGYWVYLGTAVKQGLAAMIEQQRANGVVITHGPASMGGFPLGVTVRLTDVSARASAAQGGWAWSSPAIVLESRPLTPTTLHLDLGEAHHWIRHPQAPPPGSFRLDADTADLSVRVDGRGHPRAIDLTLANARAAPLDASGAAQGSAIASLDALSLSYRHKALLDAGPRQVTETLSATMTGLDLTGVEDLPLGPRVSAAAVEAVVLGSISREMLLEDALRTWRDADGRLRLDRLEVTWDPLGLRAAGALALDAALQPEGTVNAVLWGFSDAIDAMRIKKLIRSRDATMAKVLLGGLSQRGPDGRERLEVPLIIRDGHIWAGPVALMPLPRLPWGPQPGSLGARGLRPGFSVDRDGTVIPK